MNKARSWITKHFDLVRLVVAVLIGILLAVVVIFCISEEPGTAISKLLGGPLQSKRRFGNVIELMIPLTFAGLSITVMFTANQFNMGTEGAFYAGGAVAAAVALSVGLPAGHQPVGVHRCRRPGGRCDLRHCRILENEVEHQRAGGQPDAQLHRVLSF